MEPGVECATGEVETVALPDRGRLEQRTHLIAVAGTPRTWIEADQ
jgi:hypothetical protein